jgi:hypothetical protein
MQGSSTVRFTNKIRAIGKMQSHHPILPSIDNPNHVLYSSLMPSPALLSLSRSVGRCHGWQSKLRAGRPHRRVELPARRPRGRAPGERTGTPWVAGQGAPGATAPWRVLGSFGQGISKDGGACSGQGALAGGWRYGRGGGRLAAPRRGDGWPLRYGPTCIGEKTQKEPTVTVGWRWTVRIVCCECRRSASCKVIGWVRMVCCGCRRSASCKVIG